MCVCAFVCLFVCSCVRLFVCAFVRVFVCSFARLCVSASVRSFVCSFVRLFVCSFVRLFVCSFVRWDRRKFPPLFYRTLSHSGPLPKKRDRTECLEASEAVPSLFFIRLVEDR